MKVLLCEDVEKLGWLGDIVEVKSGYARNYLLPYGLAQVPSQGNIKALAEEKVKRSQVRKLAREKLEVVAQSVEGAEAVLVAKANEQGHLFGSVTAGNVAENLRAQGFEISDGVVRRAEHIKEVGTHSVTIKLASELTATVSVVVVSESAAEAVGEGRESDGSEEGVSSSSEEQGSESVGQDSE